MTNTATTTWRIGPSASITGVTGAWVLRMAGHSDVALQSSGRTEAMAEAKNLVAGLLPQCQTVALSLG